MSRSRASRRSAGMDEPATQLGSEYLPEERVVAVAQPSGAVDFYLMSRRSSLDDALATVTLHPEQGSLISYRPDVWHSRGRELVARCSLLIVIAANARLFDPRQGWSQLRPAYRACLEHNWRVIVNQYHCRLPQWAIAGLLRWLGQEMVHPETTEADGRQLLSRFMTAWQSPLSSAPAPAPSPEIAP